MKKKKSIKKKAVKKTLKRPAKKVLKKASAKKPAVKKEKKVGKVTHVFGQIKVAIVKVSGDIKLGDVLHIKGGTSDFDQKVVSMQIDHKKITKAKKGDVIGLKVAKKVREGAEVFKK
jgi:putative protease